LPWRVQHKIALCLNQALHIFYVNPHQGIDHEMVALNAGASVVKVFHRHIIWHTVLSNKKAR
jgi:hypothetical protein